MRTRTYYSKELIEKIVSESNTYSKCLEKLKIGPSGGNYLLLKYWIKEYNVYITHFETKSDRIKSAAKYRKQGEFSLEKVLVKNCNYSRKCLKNKLYKNNIKKRICELCSQGEEWNGKHMSLILDHINGVSNDNRLENLRIVCPNCNATLDTHAGKNIKRKQTLVA